MSLPYFPLYPKDFEAKTSYLTLEEDGAYNRLLRLCWLTPGCSLPDDPAWIARRLRVDSATYDRIVAPLIAEFFKRTNGRVWQPTLTEIYQETNEKHSRRVEAGKLGGRPPKALKTQETTPSNAKAMPKQPEPEPEVKGEAKASQKNARGSRLPDDWFLPMDWGEWAMTEGVDRDFIRSEADRFKDYWLSKAGKDAVKLDWQATWRNWIRTAKDRKHVNGNRIPESSQGGKRPDPALAQIARLTGLDGTQGNVGSGVGSPFEEGGSLWVGQRPQ